MAKSPLAILTSTAHARNDRSHTNPISPQYVPSPPNATLNSKSMTIIPSTLRADSVSPRRHRRSPQTRIVTSSASNSKISTSQQRCGSSTAKHKACYNHFHVRLTIPLPLNSGSVPGSIHPQIRAERNAHKRLPTNSTNGKRLPTRSYLRKYPAARSPQKSATTSLSSTPSGASIHPYALSLSVKSAQVIHDCLNSSPMPATSLRLTRLPPRKQLQPAQSPPLKTLSVTNISMLS